MRDLKFLTFSIVVFFQHQTSAQINLVRNSNFEEGEECICFTASGGHSPDFRANFWEVCGPEYKNGDFPTPDWFLFPLCLSDDEVNDWLFAKRRDFLPEPLYSHGVVGMIADKDDWLEGIRIELKENLKAGSTYLIKMKIGFGLNSFNNIKGTYKIGIHFAKFDEKWFDNPNKTDNVQWLYAQTFERQGSNYYSKNEFVSLQLYFTVPDQVDGGSGSDLRNLIVKPNPENFGNFNYTYAYIDDVELYEVSSQKCNSDWIIENRIYEYHELPIEASGTITAGKSVLNNNADGPVICDAKKDSMFGDSRVIYKAGKRVNLKSGFRVEKEAYFKAQIASCGSECLTPKIDIGIAGELLICDNNPICFTLGSKELYGMSYEWSSSSTVIENLLTNMKQSGQIYLCIPNTVPNGRYTITYKVKNKCGQEAIKDIPLYINRTPFTGSPGAVHKFSTLDWGGFNFDGSKQHLHYKANIEINYCDEVVFEVFDENENLIYRRNYYLDVDFVRRTVSNRPNIVVDFYRELPCGDYTMKFTLKNKCNGNTDVYSEITKYRCSYQ